MSISIQGMARIVNPEGLGYLYLFVHNHRMQLRAENGNDILNLGNIETADLLDTLEANHFQILNIRQMVTTPGLGQWQGQSDRLFVMGRHKNDRITPWRNCNINASAAFLKAET